MFIQRSFQIPGKLGRDRLLNTEFQIDLTLGKRPYFWWNSEHLAYWFPSSVKTVWGTDWRGYEDCAKEYMARPLWGLLGTHFYMDY